MKNLLFLFAILLLTQCGGPSNPADEQATATDYLNETSEAFDQRMEWWRDAGFGMFIHWGPYAVPAGEYQGETVDGIGEWIMNNAQIPIEEYEAYARQFNPTEYDAEEWVGIAKDAGMKYIIITSKHHDGFALWDSEVSDYDVIDYAPIDRDLLAELKEACDEAGIVLGFYHSIMDWHHPDAQAPHYPTYNTREKSNPNFPRYYENYLKPQVQELVENYDPAVLWFDGEWIPEYTHEQGLEMYRFVRSLKPDIIVNNRVDKGRQGMQGMNRADQDYAGDFGTPEQEILEGQSDFDWEACMTMNDSWGYKAADDNWKSAETLVHNIVDIMAKGGNYLLNVGPTAEGLIPEPSVERLAEIGDWMDVNGEIVYESRSLRDFKEGDDIYFLTDKAGETVYVATTAWPGQQLRFSQWRPDDGATATFLGHGPVEWAADGDATVVTIPAELQNAAERPCDYAWVVKFE